MKKLLLTLGAVASVAAPVAAVVACTNDTESASDKAIKELSAKTVKEINALTNKAADLLTTINGKLKTFLDAEEKDVTDNALMDSKKIEIVNTGTVTANPVVGGRTSYRYTAGNSPLDGFYVTYNDSSMKAVVYAYKNTDFTTRKGEYDNTFEKELNKVIIAAIAKLNA